MGHIGTAGSRHPIERVLWAVVVGLALYGAFYISNSTWRRYQDTPTVVSLERDYMAWNTTFPAITLCPMPEGRVEPEHLNDEVRDLAREFNIGNEDTLRAFVEGLASSSLYTLSSIPEMPDIPADRFLQIIEKVSRSWDYSVVASLASDIATATYNPKLVPTLTELGMCFSFNSVVAPYVSPKYWRLGDAAIQSDMDRGLLEVNPMDGSVFAQLSGLPTAYQLFVHGPGEVPELQSRFLTSPEGQFKRLEVSALAVHTTKEARWLSPDQRRCRFTDEPIRDAVGLRIPVYSYNLCRRACRANIAQIACGCVPHLYGPMYDAKGSRIPFCDLKAAQCIMGILENLQTMTEPRTGRKMECNCLPNCDDVSYVVESDVNNVWFLGTDLKWGLSKYPRMRLKRNLLFGVTDLLVHVGSAAGLFLGCSVLSVIELVYFFTLRLYWYARFARTSQAQSRGAPGHRVVFTTPPVSGSGEGEGDKDLGNLKNLSPLRALPTNPCLAPTDSAQGIVG